MGTRMWMRDDGYWGKPLSLSRGFIFHKACRPLGGHPGEPLVPVASDASQALNDPFDGIFGPSRPHALPRVFFASAMVDIRLDWRSPVHVPCSRISNSNKSTATKGTGDLVIIVSRRARSSCI